MNEFKEPILLIGIGGAGLRVANELKKYIRFDSVIISQDNKDSENETDFIKISTNGFVNPSVNLVRGFAIQQSRDFQRRIAAYETIILVANLAGKGGAAVGPIVAKEVKEAGKNLISFVIMPFKFEKDRIFSSGLSLKRIKTESDSTVIFDNDAILECNPQLTVRDCYRISNSAIIHVIASLNSAIIGQTGILSTSENKNLEVSLREAMKMLYQNVSVNSIKHSMVYIMGTEKVPLRTINTINSITNSISDGNSSINMNTEASGSGVVMISTVQGETRFDKYDPLGVIPQENTLDWNEPECSIDCKLDLYQLE